MTSSKAVSSGWSRHLCWLFALALEWDRSTSRGTQMAFHVFPLSSLEVTPCRKHTARSSQLIAKTWTEQQQQAEPNMSTCCDLTPVDELRSHLIIESYGDHNHFANHSDPTRTWGVVRVHSTPEPHLAEQRTGSDSLDKNHLTLTRVNTFLSANFTQSKTKLKKTL